MTEPCALVLRRDETMEEMAREVVVALVEVEFRAVKFCAVKFWRVVEPDTRRLESVVMPV